MSCLNYDSSEFQCIVHLLDGRQLPAGIKTADKPATLLARIAQVLSLTQLDFFGLRFVCPVSTTAPPDSQPSVISDSEFSLWLNPKKTFLQQLKHWVHSPQQLHLHFGVRFYPGVFFDSTQSTYNYCSTMSSSLSHQVLFLVCAADPCKVADASTRYQLFLQVRADLERLAGAFSVPHELALELAALALQSEV